MKDVLAQIRAAEAHGLYYVALMTALTIPDMCGAAETPEEKVVRVRWVRWFSENMPERYTQLIGEGDGWLSAERAYLFRCSMLHEGSGQLAANRKPTKYRLVFLMPTEGFSLNAEGVISSGDGQTAILIKMSVFVDDLLTAAERWLAGAGQAPEVRARMDEHFVRSRPDGFPPNLVGVPVIA